MGNINYKKDHSDQIECPKHLLSHASKQYNRIVKLTIDTLGENDKDECVDRLKRKGLNLNEVLQLKPPDGVLLSFNHLGTLFAIDEEKNGYFSETNLLNFTQNYYCKYCTIVTEDAVATDDGFVEMDGHFTLCLWRSIDQIECHKMNDTKKCEKNPADALKTPINDLGSSDDADKIEPLVNWLIMVLTNLGEIRTFKSQPGIAFIHSDNLHSLYKLIDIHASYNIDFQAFLDVVQRSGEDQGLMHLDEADFDDVVPLVILENFLTEYFRSIISMMKELDFVG